MFSVTLNHPSPTQATPFYLYTHPDYSWSGDSSLFLWDHLRVSGWLCLDIDVSVIHRSPYCACWALCVLFPTRESWFSSGGSSVRIRLLKITYTSLAWDQGNRRIQEYVDIYFIFCSKYNKQQGKILRVWMVTWTNDKMSLQLRHSSSVASCCTCCCHGAMYYHNSWMENTLHPDKHECSEMKVTCTVGLWEPLAWWYRRPGLTYMCLGRVDKGMVNRILFVWRERQAVRYYSTGWCCWWWTRRLQRIGVKC